MWIPIILILTLALGVLIVLLRHARARERGLTEDLAQSQLTAQQTRAAAQQAATEAQQAYAHAQQLEAQTSHALAQVKDANTRLEAARDVEQRYRGILDLESAMTALEIKRVEAEAQHLEQRTRRQEDLDGLDGEVRRLRHELAALTDEEYFADFGIYSTRYDFPTSERYREALDAVRQQQKDAVKAGSAAICHVPWTVEGSKTKGRKMTADNLKMMIRAFNGESDAAIAKVTYKNIAAIEQRIWKAKERIDRLNVVNRCELTQAYVELKVEELRLFYEYACKKEDERQEQREIREQIREEKRAQQELEKERKKAEEEEERYTAALEKARKDVLQATGAKQAKMAAKIAELETRLAEAHANKERAISQAQLTRAGHVYVISNVGSFGEGVFKIGMTRRLDPMDRVKELGDASVPFSFDVHAIIRSQDAPSLEKDLHRRFTERRVNLVNERKEFFHVKLDEIEAAVIELHGEIEFTMAAEAMEYRESVVLRRQRSRSSESSMKSMSMPQVGPSPTAALSS